MKVKTKDVFLVILIGVVTSPTFVFTLTGLCETDTGSEVCSACKSLSKSVSSLSRDCCGDPDAYAICSYCFQNPESCQQAGEILSDIMNEMEVFERRQTRSGGSQSSLPYHIAPQRRAKYFLGKRGGMSLATEFEDEDEYNKRSRNFPNGGSRHFLGKRFYDDDVDEEEMAMADKRVKLFLGKRDVTYTNTNPAVDNTNKVVNVVGADDDAGEGLWEGDKAKRKVSPFLGKRAEVNSEMDDKEKRGRLSPFLGKRDDDGEEEDLVSEKRGGSFFLGKRSDLNSDNVDKLEDIYVRPLTRRAKYFLGKRSDGHKRQKYFLGKRTPSSSAATGQHHQLGLMSQGLDKRQKFFLGKRTSL